jgi:hypothetical protein
MMDLKKFFIQLIEHFFNWIIDEWRTAKTTANLNQEIRKYHEAAEELDPQPQVEIKENGVFGEPGWFIEISNPAFTSPDLDKPSDPF